MQTWVSSSTMMRRGLSSLLKILLRGRSLTPLPGLREGSGRVWRDSWRTPLLSLSWEGSRKSHYHTAFMQLWPFPCALSVLCNSVMYMNEHKKRGNGLFKESCMVFMVTWGWNVKKMIKPIPFSYELGHLFLHLFPLQLFLQQNLKSCDAAVALGIFLIGLR